MSQLIKYIQKIKLSKTKYSKKKYVIIGFSCDEGVKRNNGILGASKGPNYFRKALNNLSCSKNQNVIFDIENVNCINCNLETAQKKLATCIKKVLKDFNTPIIIGGGHEVSFGHYLGIMASKHYPAIINFDAHFDLRLPIKEGGTSGSAFKQITNLLIAKNKKFSYYCCGIQQLVNSTKLFNYVKKKCLDYQTAVEINKNPYNLSHIKDIIRVHNKIYVTICLDVFDISIVPGVSASQIFGIKLDYVLGALKLLKKSGNLISLDIVELNPLTDIKKKTVKIAASIIVNYITR